MTDKKISQLTNITGANVDDANDEIAIVDASASETKAITRAELFSGVAYGSFDGDVTVGGNLTVNGTTVTIDTTTLDVADKNITIAKDAPDAATADGAGITVDGANANITYDSTDDTWDFNKGISTTGDIEVIGTVDGRDVAADGSKLDGIESGATADQTAGEIKTAYESNADTNAFTDAEQSKLSGIEAGAEVNTVDSVNTQTGAVVLDADDIDDSATTNKFTTAADLSKLSGIEAGADVTDTANVTAAGALMDSELTSEASVKALDQGVATTDSPSFAGVTATTADINGGTIDGTVIGGTTPAAISGTTGTFSGELNAEGRELLPLAKGDEIGTSGDWNTIKPNAVGYYDGGSGASNRGNFSSNGVYLYLSTRLLDGDHDDVAEERAGQLYFGDTNSFGNGGLHYRVKQGTVAGWHDWGVVLTSLSKGAVVQTAFDDNNAITQTTSQSGFVALECGLTPTRSNSRMLVMSNVYGSANDDSHAWLEYKIGSGGWVRSTALNGTYNSGMAMGDYSIVRDFSEPDQPVGFGTSVVFHPNTTSEVRVRVICSAESTGGFNLNIGTSRDTAASYNNTTAKSTLVIQEIAWE